MEKTVLVTGGAGYIGSVAVKTLVEKGYKVIVVDNLSKGLRDLVHEQAGFYELDLKDKAKLEAVFNENSIDSVMHFASYKAVGESMENPVKYSDNIAGTVNLLDCMVKFNVKKIIYSSSAAVYGMPSETPITEEAETKPINYYGYTKLVCGQLIHWYSQIHGIKFVSLRYFNVAGDAGLNYIDPAAENILPILMEVITGKREKLVINGNDYETHDGTCVRDYIDVQDLVDAHILALDVDFDGDINLGTSKGVSVKELVDATIEVTGKELPWEYGPRRPGDPAVLVASNIRATEILNWHPKKSINDMIESTFKAYH